MRVQQYMLNYPTLDGRLSACELYFALNNSRYFKKLWKYFNIYYWVDRIKANSKWESHAVTNMQDSDEQKTDDKKPQSRRCCTIFF